MKNSSEQLKEKYALCSQSEVEYETDGQKYTVVRYFAEDRDLNKLINELAVNRANRETGLQ